MRTCKTAPSYLVAITLINGGGGGERNVLIFFCLFKYLDHQSVHPCATSLLAVGPLQNAANASGTAQCSLCAEAEECSSLLKAGIPRVASWSSFCYIPSLHCSGDKLNFSFCSYCNLPGAAWVFFFLFLLKKTPACSYVFVSFKQTFSSLVYPLFFPYSMRRDMNTASTENNSTGIFIRYPYRLVSQRF